MKEIFSGISVKGLGKQYGHFSVLDDVTFELPAGNYLTLFGRNGAGKTTLLRILASLLRPSKGTIQFGRNTLNMDMAIVRQNIGYISHNSMLYGDLTASENLHYYAKLYGVKNREAVVRESLEKVGLKSWADSPVRSFSRGMQQRLAIARAFQHRPRYLFLDEPYSGLDQNAIKSLTALLHEFHKPEHTAIITTHQLEEGWEIADLIAVLERGKLCFFQRKQEISFDDFKMKYTEIQG